MSNVYLKVMEEIDLEKVLEWRNSERVRQGMYTNRNINLDEHINWFHSCRERKDIKNFVCYLADKAIGVVNITDIDFENRTCSWSIYRGEENCPHGIGFQMGKCVLEYIFNELKMRKVYVDILGNNTISKNFHEKLGFKVEGVFKEQIVRNGFGLDVLRLAIFR